MANMVGISSILSTTYNANTICCSCQLGNDTWILDSGASDHMSYDANILHDLKMFETPISVSLPNGHKVQVSHSGKLRLNNWIELHMSCLFLISNTIFC